MKKKTYTTPQTEVVEMKNNQPLLAGSDIVTTIDTDFGSGTDGIGFGGGGTGPATSKEAQDLQEFISMMGM